MFSILSAISTSIMHFSYKLANQIIIQLKLQATSKNFYKRFFVAVFSVFAHIWFTFLCFSITDVSKAIKCYRCTVAPTHRMLNRTQQLCAQFSESDEFTIDCPYSTMCMKKVFWYQLQDGTKIETVSRNCADQKYTEQVSGM